MKFSELKIKDAYLIEIEPIEDERGFFSRGFCIKEMKEKTCSMLATRHACLTDVVVAENMFSCSKGSTVLIAHAQS